MSKFSDYLQIKWEHLSNRDKQMAIMSALKSASMIMEGSKIQPQELIDYAEKLLEHFYQFEFLQKPKVDESLATKVNKEFEEAGKKVPF